jgi:uncharacterized protein YndB with AHSA1/START domain
VTHETTIVVDDGLPLVRIWREFDAPVERVYRAHVDPSLFVRWIGPADMDAKVEHWDARTGGSWRYVARRGDFEAVFWGCFHELRDNELVIQTQTFTGAPDRVSLDRLALEAISANRTRLVCTSLHESFEDRDALIASGMELGLRQGYKQLDRLLFASPAARASRRPGQVPN